MHTPIDPNYPLLPSHIDVEREFVGVFGGFDRVIERAAHVVMSFLVTRGTGWESFSDEDIQRHFQLTHPREKARSRRFSYKRRLHNGGFLIINGKEITVTHELVALCFLMSKAK